MRTTFRLVGLFFYCKLKTVHVNKAFKMLEQPSQTQVIQPTEPPQLQPQQNQMMTVLLTLGCVFLLAIVGVSGYYLGARSNNTISPSTTIYPSSTDQASTPSVMPSNEANTNISNGTDSISNHVYKVMFQSPEKNMDSTFIQSKVSEYLGVNSTLDFKVFADASFEMDNVTNNFYVLTTASRPTRANTSQTDASISFVSENPELVSFLSNPKYCMTDNDCTRNSNFCDVGSYNQYIQWETFGCGKIANVEGLTQKEIEAKSAHCPISEMDGKPAFNAEIISSRCLNNTCQATETKISCM